MSELKKKAALAALNYVEPNTIIGIGTGSTVAYFIEALADWKHDILGTVPSSKDSEKKLRALGIPVVDINAGEIPLYVDGADEFNDYCQLIKGGGGALTREKIIAACAQKFVCIADQSKHVKVLGTFPLAVEVIPMARSYVAREILKLGGNPALRDNFTTDNGNQILDVYDLDLTNPVKMEETLNNLTGVVCNGIFAKRVADVVLMATDSEVVVIS